MADKIRLLKGAEYFEVIDYCGEIVRKTKSLSEHFDTMLELGPGVTFEDFMKFIFDEEYIDTYNMIFTSYLGHHPLSHWKEEFESMPRKDWNDGGMAELQIYYDDIIALSEKYLNDMWVSTIPSFHGYGDTSYGIDFTPINDLKNYPLVLKTSFRVVDLTDIKYEKVLVNLNKIITVFDAIAAILYEISFYGSPKERNEESDELKTRLDEAKGTMEIKDLKMESFRTPEEFFDSLEKEYKKNKDKKEDEGT